MELYLNTLVVPEFVRLFAFPRQSRRLASCMNVWLARLESVVKGSKEQACRDSTNFLVCQKFGKFFKYNISLLLGADNYQRGRD